jgi:hypothetical protein
VWADRRRREDGTGVEDEEMGVGGVRWREARCESGWDWRSGTRHGYTGL